MRSYSDDIPNTDEIKTPSKVDFWWRVANTTMLVGLVLVHVVMYIAHHAA